eukprot:TRINITY_DN83086_c0_g1_i1.p1 TRINITY_DN83086_c0_g1~~TRINITY_DN83086_c0_g1_i1.p1  ORF type:complete len:319 (-),score=93.11 TRINITY_DN83086_c0_g1_i1:169-1125(-)
MESDPTELVSCGKCGSVNCVPYGLEKFKCYNCGVSVAISRELSAACAAASPTALYYESLQAGHAPSAAKESAKESKKSEGSSSSGGFFGKLQRQAEKTLQKVEQSFFFDAPSASQSSSAPAPEMPVGRPGTEKEQVQWALLASQGRGKASGAPKTSATKEAPAASATKAPAVDPQADARLRAAEERAGRAEQLLNSAMAREAMSASERLSLRQQLDETQELVNGLTHQLDSVQAEVQVQRLRCEALERELAASQEERRKAATSQSALDAEQTGSAETVSRLLARIVELEATLQRSRDFAEKEKASFETMTEAENVPLR